MHSTSTGGIPWHQRLEAQVLFGIVVIVGLSLSAVLFAANRMVTNEALHRSAGDLSAARTAFYDSIRSRSDFATAQCRLITELPIFRAHMTDHLDSATVSAMTEAYRNELKADFCIATNAEGRWLGHPGWKQGDAPPKSLVSDIWRSLSGRSGNHLMSAGNQLYLMVSEPAWFADEVLGTFTIGYRLDDGVARRLARMTRCEVNLALGSQVCASSLPVILQTRLRSAVRARASLLGRTAGSLSTWRLGGLTYTAGCYPLSQGLASGTAASLILLQPWSSTQRFLDHVEAALAWVGIVALMLSLICGLAFSHRMARPISDVAQVASQIAVGDWNRQVAVHGSAEAAVMASAFNTMTANLRYWYEEASTQAQGLECALEQTRQAYSATLQALSRALDTRDNETEGHSQRVAQYAVRLAERMGLDAAAQSNLKLGALLHDIGKIGVPDAVLRKPGKLDPSEVQAMRRHCEFGLNIVRGIPYLERAAEVIRYHHERFDGAGYPYGLGAEQIPLAARIFAVADTLDAMTSDRPYRRARPFADAVCEIERCCGTQFDPQVVHALLSMAGELSFDEPVAGSPDAPPTASAGTPVIETAFSL